MPDGRGKQPEFRHPSSIIGHLSLHLTPKAGPDYRIPMPIEDEAWKGEEEKIVRTT